MNANYLKTLWKSSMMVLMLCFGLTSLWGQETLAGWTFPTSSEAAPLTINAECGTGTIYANGTNGSSLWTSNTSNYQFFSGNATAGANQVCGVSTATGALSPTGNGNNGKHIVFKISTTGFEDLKLTYDTRGTSTGFSTHTWAFSTNGTEFTEVSVITGRTNTNFSSQTVDFASYSASDNQTDLYIRLTVSGASGGGNNRLDNIKFTATTIPSTPSISIDPTFITGLQSIENGAPSTPTSFTLTGSNLDGTDVTVTADGVVFEISETETGSYSDEVSLSAYDGSEKTIWVRLAGIQSEGVKNDILLIDGGGIDELIEIPVQGEVLSSDPILTIIPDEIETLSYTFGEGPSTPESFTISGLNMDGNGGVLLMFTESADFEISFEANANYAGDLLLEDYDGTETTVYVRLKSGRAIGNTYEDILDISTDYGVDGSLLVFGEVLTPPATTTVSETALGGITYVLDNGPSEEQSFTVEGSYLTSDITVTAPTNYQVSLSSGSGFQNSVTLTSTEGTVAETTVYVQLNAGLGVNNYNGDITISATGVVNKTVTLSGSVTCGASTLPYSEDFESVTTPNLPNCTTVVQGGSGNLWTTSSPNESGFTSKALTYQWHNDNDGDTWFFTNGLQLEGGQSYRLSFRYGNNSTLYSENLRVAYGTSNSIAAMTTELADYPNINDNTPHSVTINFEPATTGTYYIGFHAYSEHNNYRLYVDDILVEENVPTISVEPATVPTFTAVTDDSDSEDIIITGILLSDNIDIALSGTNADQFSLSATSLDSVGGTLTVTYEPTTVGDHNATLTLSSTDATDVMLTLNGTATLGVPVATAATAIGSDSFTANWNAVAGAESYEIDVYTMESGGFATDLFISEYLEGSSNNKYLEIFNGTGVTVNLSEYKIQLFTNGSSTAGSTQNLSSIQPTLAHGATIVLKNTQSNLSLPAGVTTTNSGVCGFNGDDAIALLKGDIRIDIFGRIGNDPGDEWTGAGGYTTLDKTLRRKSSVTSGVSVNPSGTGSTAFTTLTTEWDLYDIDTVSGLGSHTFDGGLSIVYTLEAENVGNITSYEVTGLDPETTYYYVVRAVAGAETSVNSNEIEVETLAAVVWTTDNAWLNDIEPTINDDVVIAGTLSVGTDFASFSAKTITVNGSLTIEADNSVTVAGKITNNGEFTVENDGILIQTPAYTGANEGAITVLRDANPMKRLDYTLWSSPVSGMLLNEFSDISDNGGTGTIYSRVYELGATAWTSIWGTYAEASTSTDTFDAAKGYLYRAFNSYDAVTQTTFTGEFTGVPHNGNYSINTPNTFDAVGNPYPSPIEANNFIIGNTGVSAVYFWTNVNSSNGTAYTHNNWASYTTVGGVGVAIGGDSDNIDPESIPADDMHIQPGQGFVVYTEVTTTSVAFNNTMRVADANGAFFKQMSNEKHRFWLNLSNEEVVFNQILVGYIEDATQGVDTGIDGKMFAYEGNALYSTIENSEENYVIQGRALPFEVSDVVALGFRAVNAGSFTISLHNFDGLFADSQSIYLKDNYTQALHNLKDGAYSFVSDEGIFDTRFEVVYQTTMSVENPVTNNANWVVYSQENGFQIQTQGFELQNVQVFDLLGRAVYKAQAQGTAHNIPALGADSVYIVKVTTTDNVVLSKKVR